MANLQRKGAQLESNLWRTPEAVFVERRRRLSDICMNDPEAQAGGVERIFTHQSSGVIYCFVPKAGCTFWKRMFLALNRPGVFSLDRVAIHKQAGYGRPFRKGIDDWRHYPTRFTVARDPFSRVLSTYLDKAYLPDFWMSNMLNIVQRLKLVNETFEGDFMRSHYDKMAAQYDPKFTASSTSTETSCGKYVTFAQFVTGILELDDPHWMPLSELCNPCQFNVTHLIYMETFTQDSRIILDRLGLDGLLDHQDKNSQVHEEFDIIVDYNFRKLSHDNYVKRCSSTRELAYRLWNNFRWRGYIDPEVAYIAPARDEMKFVRDNLMKQLAEGRTSGLQNRTKLKAAQEEFRRQFYLTLSKDLFKKLEQKYALDFKFYGYEKLRDQMDSSILER
ncbi:hypothetical protein RRG08_007136 [Elysia crispata]|uniref:Carbohydrate sulfotransferase n=1 Tax=Elysia crispata TaxID=231223 RepID=A0AAE1CUA2_9GAST|nr:hypothetical protein RRG08_007136 [Elysia crispata]